MRLLKEIKKLCEKIFFKQDDPNTQVIKKIIDRNPILLSDELKDEWKEAFKELEESLEITTRSEAEKFDKGILTLSSIFLGFTLTFVDKIIPLNKAWYRWLLFISWVSFFFSIVFILIGLIVNQRAIKQIISDASKYLLERNLNYSNFADNKLNRWADRLNYISLILFVGGAGTFILFVIINVTRL